MIPLPASAARTRIDGPAALQFLKQTFSPDITSLEAIRAGETSQVFSFHCGAGDFIIRVNKSKNGFEKDEYACAHFCSAAVPIPETVQSGKIDEALFYSITRKASGKTLDLLKHEEMPLSGLIATLEALHATDISQTSGCGGWNAQGHGAQKNWAGFLLEPIIRYSGVRSRDFRNVLLEEPVIRSLIARYERMIDHCPEARYLVQGDYGFNNLLTENGAITAVIDWEASLYGDFLYDIAWLSFWDEAAGYPKIFLEHYQRKGTPLPKFGERLLCYQLHIAIGALGFFSDSQQRDKYAWARTRALGLIED